MQNNLTPDVIEAARKLFAGPCDFMAGVANLEQLPPDGPPEIAFIGRSNVGKSSLLNALTNRKALARVSNTPGRTQQLNFFTLADKLRLVDLPGYGYAKVSKTDRRDWNFLIKDYLRGRTTLARVMLLIDSRHGLKESDREFLKLLDQAAVATQIVLTKTDMTKPAELAAVVEQVQKDIRKHPAIFPHMAAVSSDKGVGVEELRAYLYGVAYSV